MLIQIGENSATVTPYGSLRDVLHSVGSVAADTEALSVTAQGWCHHAHIDSRNNWHAAGPGLCLFGGQGQIGHRTSFMATRLTLMRVM
jgi:hypothetical protein